MQIRNSFLVLIFFLSFISALAQKNSPKKNVIKPLISPSFKTTCDCKDAVKINVLKTTTYGLTEPPSGFGSIQEITSKHKSDKLSFEEEHNTAWYLLNIIFNGELAFEIIPKDSSNDYDFLLYKYTDSTFCKALQKKLLKPIRSNLSRVSTETKGITGLSSEAKNEFVGKGIGSAYSKSVSVLKGEKYVLVLDNVYPEGKGHTINFNYIKQVTISGVVTDADSVPIKAEVSLTDNKGIIVKQMSTENDGKYLINTGMKEDYNYSLAFSSDSSFFAIKTINTKELKQSNVFTDIRTVLVRLKKGTKYSLSSINFYGDQSILLPSSYSSVFSLYKLMQKNKKMIIRIEGHINLPGRVSKNKIFEQTLSDDRAKTVSEYLQSQGIEKERISSIGYAASKMLYPNPKNETEMSANRRVEINVISIK